MFVFPLDGMTIGCVIGCVIGVVAVVVEGVAVVAVVAAVPDFAVLLDVDDVVGDVVDAVADVPVVAVRVEAFAVLVVAPPACDARPANRPVPATAPASDQRVSFVIRRSPASRLRRLLRFSEW